MAHTGKASDIWHPNSIQLSISGQTVIMVVKEFTIFIVFRIPTATLLAVLCRIFRIDPAVARPHAGEGSLRRQVNHIKERCGIVHRIRSRVARIPDSGIDIPHRICCDDFIKVETVRERVIELV